MDGSILSASGYSLQYLFQSPARAPFVRGGDKPAFELIANHFSWRRSRARAASLELQRVQRSARGTHPGGSELSTNPGLTLGCLPPPHERRSSSPPALLPARQLGAVPSFGSKAEQILSMGCLVWRHQQLLLQVPLPAPLPHRPAGDAQQPDAGTGLTELCRWEASGRALLGCAVQLLSSSILANPKNQCQRWNCKRFGKEKKRRDVEGGQVVRQLQPGAWLSAGIPGIPPGIRPVGKHRA